MDNKQKQPYLRPDLSDGELIELGVALESLTQHEGWPVFEAFVEQAEERAWKALRDPDYDVGHARGALDFRDHVFSNVKEIISRSQELRGRREGQTEPLPAPPIARRGGGSIAGA